MTDSNSPPTSPPPPSEPAEAPGEQVNLPAICIIVMGGLNILTAIALLGMALFGIGMSAIGGSVMIAAFTGIRVFFYAIAALIIGGVCIAGGLRMRQLRDYPLALAGAIAAGVPCSCCCIVGIFPAIWAILVLLKPDVKAAFK